MLKYILICTQAYKHKHLWSSNKCLSWSELKLGPVDCVVTVASHLTIRGVNNINSNRLLKFSNFYMKLARLVWLIHIFQKDR